MDSLLSLGTLDNVLRWDEVELDEIQALLSEAESEDPEAGPLPRSLYSQRCYVASYGSHPSMEDRIFSKCVDCRQVFSPHTAAGHEQACPGKLLDPQRKKKVKSKKNHASACKKINNKKKHQALPSPRPLAAVDPPLVLTKITSVPEVLTPLAEPEPAAPPPPIAPPPSPPPEEAVSGRHKKSKKAARAVKEIDVEEESAETKGATRSLNNSANKISSKKSMVERSIRIPSNKKIPIDAVDKKDDFVEETLKTSHFDTITNDFEEYLFTKSELDLEFKSDFSEIDISDKIHDFETLHFTELPENELHDEIESDDPSNLLESGSCSIESSLSTSTKTSPVLYYNPISPIFVVTPVKFIQKENTVFVESPQRALNPSASSYFVAMPETTANITLYKSHPKPAAMPTYGARKVGGAILSSYRRLEYRVRNGLQESIAEEECAKAPAYASPQRSILLKTKTLGKVSFKRTAPDKLNANDNSKQIKLSADMNGFIIHTEMSEVAETPQSTHCIQENINLLNMK